MPYAFERESNMTKNTALLGRSFRPGSAGFTVLELGLLLAVISILCAIGFPMYLSYSRAQETDGAARVIVVALNQARQLAITRGVSFSAETQTTPNNRMRFCSGTVVPGPTITFSSLGAATANGILRVQNSSATGSLDVCVAPSGRIRVQAVGTACPPN